MGEVARFCDFRAERLPDGSVSVQYTGVWPTGVVMVGGRTRSQLLERMSQAMTALGTPATTAATPVSAGHVVVNAAVSHAVRRDLDRLVRVLGEPVTAVRRDALAAHVRYLLDQVATHQLLQDTVIWPAAVAVQPDRGDVGEQVRCAHHELDAPFALLRTAAAEWRVSAERRLVVRSAVQALTLVLPSVLDRDTQLLPLACAALGPVAGASWTVTPWAVGRESLGRGTGDRGALGRDAPAIAVAPASTTASARATAGRTFAAPTKVARRLFWLLDELDARTAAALLDRTPRATLWILRNGFSGAYNRQSYLMWVGGGTGPAV